MSQDKIEIGPSLSMDDMRSDAVKITFTHTHYTGGVKIEPMERVVYYPINDGVYVFFPVFCAVCDSEMQILKKEKV